MTVAPMSAPRTPIVPVWNRTATIKGATDETMPSAKVEA